MTPAEQLEGMKLDNEWLVVKKINHTPDHTGGRFSTAYLVKNNTGDEAFLKALDYTEALNSPDPARALQALTESYNFERNLLDKCKNKKMSRIVRALEFGKTKIGTEVTGVVEYIIFELAQSDLREQYTQLLNFDYAWKFKTLHHIATGIWQLHGAKISHQDLKPSNVLVFKGDESKLSDLGRASTIGIVPPHDNLEIAGDKTYAPPELLYHEIPADWNQRRFGCDLFLLGSMITYLFTGLPINAFLYDKLDIQFHFNNKHHYCPVVLCSSGCKLFKNNIL
jgi:serine/threonine protein kinase